MSIADSIPGMRSGSGVRNAALGLAYLCLLPVAIVFLPITLAIAVGCNVRGAADRLTVLPGVDRGGGVGAAVAGAAFGLALLAALGAVLPSNGADADASHQQIEGAVVFEPSVDAFASVSTPRDDGTDGDFDPEGADGHANG